MCDSKKCMKHFTQGKKSDNHIINDKIYFINQLTEFRNLKMNFQLIDKDKNCLQDICLQKVKILQEEILLVTFENYANIINIILSNSSLNQTTKFFKK